jgi:hypothetical protein
MLPAMTREEELLRQGWKKRSTCDEPRLSELAAMYREIGLEVRIEAFDPLSEPGCSDCMQADAGRYRTIYTRPGRGNDKSDTLLLMDS